MSKKLTMKYTDSFEEILFTIKEAKREVFKQVNSSLIVLYWNVGQYISEKVKNSDWGKGIVLELSQYIKEKEPNIKGFSANNIWRMKHFYDIQKNSPQCGENKELTKLPSLWTELSWSHHRRIMALKVPEEREFYILLCVKQKYSVRELEKLINSSTFERTMIANKNLPDQIKRLPQNTENIFKDAYVFDFLNLPKKYKEKDLQKALVSSLKDFILELGKGFSFIGEEYRLQVGNEDFYVDLLFFIENYSAWLLSS